MTIHLSKDLEKFVQDAVRDGLYAREDDVIRDALLRLRQTMPDKKTKRAKPPQQKKPLTPGGIRSEIAGARPYESAPRYRRRF